MRIFVAGATGAVGRLLVPMLLGSGHEVFGTSRTEAGVEQLRRQGACAIRLDAFDRRSVTEAVRRARPDAIVHQLTALSAGRSVDNARIRTEGTRNLVDAALAVGTPRMVVQSIAWAYESGSEPAHESTPFDVHASEPRATTVAGVQALEVAALEVVQPIVLRYGVFYGPGTWYAPGGPIPDRIRTGVLAANDAVTSFLHVHDAAWAALQALSWPIGTYNIVDDEPARACDWVPRLARVLNVPAPAPTAGREPWERGASNQRARSRLARALRIVAQRLCGDDDGDRCSE